MALSREEKIMEREKTRKTIKEVLKDRDEIITRKTDAIQKQYEKIESQIKELQDQRSELLSGAVTKEEVLKNAKESLHGGKRSFINSLMSEHLKVCQEKNIMPFSHKNLKIHLLDESKVWKLFFFSVSEKDLEEAVALLPDIGMSTKEREGKIKEIDKEIFRLSKLIKDELQGLKK